MKWIARVWPYVLVAISVTVSSINSGLAASDFSDCLVDMMPFSSHHC